MKVTRLSAFAALAAFALAAPASANHSWNGYHWATTNGVVSVRINAALTAPWPAYLDTAIGEWEQSTHLTLGSRVDVGVSRRKCTPITGQILVCNDAYGPRGWLGIASINLDSNGHITKGTTKLNDTYFNMAQYNTAAWRRMVTCQEIGHDFGLGHQDEGFSNTNLGSCMDYTNDPAGTAGTNGTKANISPDAHDYEQLGLIYNHSNDGYSTGTMSSATNFGIRDFTRPAPPVAEEADVGDSPAQWGRAIHFDKLGRPDVFELALSGGGRRVTHVFWALETKRSDIQHD